MSGPDRRDTRLNKGFVGGADPEFEGDEDYVVQIVGSRRAYHIRADVTVIFDTGTDTPTRFPVAAAIETQFAARHSATEWNGQNALEDRTIRQTRDEYVSLDTGAGFIEDSGEGEVI